jgi:hypothetical protein
VLMTAMTISKRKLLNYLSSYWFFHLILNNRFDNHLKGNTVTKNSTSRKNNYTRKDGTRIFD